MHGTRLSNSGKTTLRQLRLPTISVAAKSSNSISGTACANGLNWTSAGIATIAAPKPVIPKTVYAPVMVKAVNKKLMT
jgi:hypothetical protein